MKNKELDIKLREILKDVKPSWNGQKHKDIIMIEKAIKSKYPSVKLDVINRFR